MFAVIFLYRTVTYFDPLLMFFAPRILLTVSEELCDYYFDGMYISRGNEKGRQKIWLWSFTTSGNESK